MAVTPLQTLGPPDGLRVSRGSATRRWYMGDPSKSFSQIIESAFEEAKSEFFKLLEPEDDKTWIDQTSSAEEVVKALAVAKSNYDQKSNSKAHKWLALFARRVNYYDSILDDLGPHNPDYDSLVWGAMKFLFIAVMNHEEATHKLAKALSRIADSLPRRDLTLILHPTSQMQRASSLLYAHILQFLVHACRWYKQGKFKHALGANGKPYTLDFADEVSAIDELARTVDDLATAASQSELRDARLKLIETQSELNKASLDVQRLGQLVSSEFSRMIEIATSTRSLSHQLQLNLESQKAMIRTVQLNQMVSAPFMVNIPASGQSLAYCSSLRRRRQLRISLPAQEVARLQKCAMDPSTQVMIMETQSRTDARDTILDILLYIREAQRPVLWALRFQDYWEKSFSIEDVLRTLVLQALEINSEALAQEAYPVTLASLRSASDQEDWLRILDRSLKGFEEVYIVIDPDLLQFAASDNLYRSTKMLEALCRTVASTRIKLMVSSRSTDRQYISRNWPEGNYQPIFTTSPENMLRTRIRRQRKNQVRRRNR